MSLKHSILALLARKPRSGYDLSKTIEGSTGFFWTATHQQIYRDLAEIENRGWAQHKDVEQTEKPDKKVYSLTKDGMGELRRWLDESTEPMPSKDSLLIKLFVGDLAQLEKLIADLLHHKEIHQARRKKYMEIEKTHFQNVEKLPIERQYQFLTLRRGIGYENAWLAWCEETEEFLKKKARSKKFK